MAALRALRTAPWAIGLEAAMVAKRHWQSLPEADRRKLKSLIAKSKGQPQNLTARERAEIRRIASQLDVMAMGRELLPFAGRMGRRR